MRPLVKYITKAQQEYRDSIIKKKMRHKKKIIEIHLPEPITRETYMKNCIFWIKEYYERKVDKERAKRAVFYLRQYCDEIIRELTSDHR